MLLFELNNLRKKYTSNELIKKAIDYRWMWEDQCILNSISIGHTLYLDKSWNVIWVDNETIQNMMEFDLSYLRSMQEPKIVHYAGGTLPTKNNNSPFSCLFWKYARLSPYYERLIYLYVHSNFTNNGANVINKKVNYNHFWEHLFSVKNEYTQYKKIKVFTILGIKIRKRVRKQK